MGGWGRDWAWRIIPAVEEVDLVACCDSDAAALKLTRQEAKIPVQPCFASLAAGIPAATPEAVVVPAPNGAQLPPPRGGAAAGCARAPGGGRCSFPGRRRRS